MNIFLNLRYRLTYTKRFIKCAKILGLPLNYRLFKVCKQGSNPRIFFDSTGNYMFNKLIAVYLDKYQQAYKYKRYREITLSDYDIKLLAINYALLELTNLTIVKYLPCMSSKSMLRMNTYLYELRNAVFDFRTAKRKNVVN